MTLQKLYYLIAPAEVWFAAPESKRIPNRLLSLFIFLQFFFCENIWLNCKPLFNRLAYSRIFWHGFGFWFEIFQTVFKIWVCERLVAAVLYFPLVFAIVNVLAIFLLPCIFLLVFFLLLLFQHFLGCHRFAALFEGLERESYNTNDAVYYSFRCPYNKPDKFMLLDISLFWKVIFGNAGLPNIVFMRIMKIVIKHEVVLG